MLHQLLQQVLQIDSRTHGPMLNSLNEIYNSFIPEIKNHFKREEKILFSYICKMDAFQKGLGPKPDIPFKHIENPISQIEYDHDRFEHQLLLKIRQLTCDYKIPPDASDKLKALFEGLKNLESEIIIHRHLETDLLFPKAIKLELSIMHG